MASIALSGREIKVCIEVRDEHICQTVTIKPNLTPEASVFKISILNLHSTTHPNLSFARFFSSLVGRRPEHLWRSSQQTTPAGQK